MRFSAQPFGRLQRPVSRLVINMIQVSPASSLKGSAAHCRFLGIANGDAAAVENAGSKGCEHRCFLMQANPIRIARKLQQSVCEDPVSARPGCIALRVVYHRIFRQPGIRNTVLQSIV